MPISPAVGGRSTGDVYAPVKRGLLAIAVLFQVAGFLARPWAWPGVVEGVLATAAALIVPLSTGVLALTLFERWHRLRGAALGVNVCVLVCSGLALQLSPVAPGGWTGSTTFLDSPALSLAALTVAFVLSPRVSAPFVVGLGIADIAFLALLGGPEPARVDVVMPGVMIAAAGLSSLAMRQLLIASGRRLVRERAATEAAAAERVDDHVRLRVEEREVRIHEQVLNVLSALKHPEAPLTSRDRSSVAAAAALLSTLDQSASRELTGDLRTDLADTVHDLQVDGVVVEVGGPRRLLVDDKAYALLVDAIREAMINTSRHARASHLRIVLKTSTLLRWPWTQRVTRVRVVDDGCGFDVDAVSRRFGLTRILGDRLRENGVQAVIRSGVGHGTEVEFAVHDSPRQPSQLSAATLGGTVLAYNATYLAVSSLAAILTLNRMAVPILSLVALVIAAAGLLGFGLVVRRYGARWWSILAMIATVIACVQVQIAAQPDPRVLWSAWAVIAANAAAFTLCIAGPWWTALAVVGASTLMAQPGPDPMAHRDEGLLALHIVVMGVVIGSILRRADRQVRTEQRRRADLWVDALSTSGVRTRMRTRLDLIRRSGTIEWLETVAVRDSHDAQAARRHEYFVRSVMRLDAASWPHHTWIADFIMEAWRRSLLTDIRLSDERIWPPRSGNDAKSPGAPAFAVDPWIRQLLGYVVSDSVVRVTGGLENGLVRLVVVAHISHEHRDAVQGMHRSEVVLDSQSGQCAVLLDLPSESQRPVLAMRSSESSPRET